MPLLRIETNAPVEQSNRDSILKSLSAKIASALAKPESYVMVKIESESLMSFAGTTDPCAYGTLVSLGLADQAIPGLSKLLTEEISSALSVDPSRIYLRFEAPDRKHFAHNGKPFG